MSHFPEAAFQKLVEKDGPVMLDGKPEQFLLKIGGKPYRHTCGANVFHKPFSLRPELYECNGCGNWLEAK